MYIYIYIADGFGTPHPPFESEAARQEESQQDLQTDSLTASEPNEPMTVLMIHLNTDEY